MAGIKALLLDLGHTLVDYDVPDQVLAKSFESLDPWLAARDIEAAKDGESPLTFKVVKSVGDAITQSYRRRELEEQDIYALFRDAFSRCGHRLDEATLHKFVPLVHDRVRRNLSVGSDTVEALKILRGRGYRLGIVSNATMPPEVMWEDLRHLGLGTFFDAVVFSSEHGLRKPHLTIYLAALEKLDMGTGDVLYVGDRLREDIRGPMALGMRAVLTHEFRQETPDGVVPEAVISRFSQVLALVDRG